MLQDQWQQCQRPAKRSPTHWRQLTCPRLQLHVEPTRFCANWFVFARQRGVCVSGSENYSPCLLGACKYVICFSSLRIASDNVFHCHQCADLFSHLCRIDIFSTSCTNQLKLLACLAQFEAVVIPVPLHPGHHRRRSHATCEASVGGDS